MKYKVDVSVYGTKIRDLHLVRRRNINLKFEIYSYFNKGFFY